MPNNQKYKEEEYLEAFKTNNNKIITYFYESQEKIFKNGILNWSIKLSDPAKRFILRNLDDIFHDAFYRLYVNILQEKIKTESLNVPLGGYMFYIGKNVALEYLRNGDIPINQENDDVLDGKRPYFVDDNPYIPDLPSEMKDKIRYYIDKLSESCYKILNLFYFGKISMKGIANLLKYANENVAKSKKHNCLEKLKKLIKE